MGALRDSGSQKPIPEHLIASHEPDLNLGDCFLQCKILLGIDRGGLRAGVSEHELRSGDSILLLDKGCCSVAQLMRCKAADTVPLFRERKKVMVDRSLSGSFSRSGF